MEDEAGAGRGSADDGIGLEESAVVLGAYAWTEGRLYEVLGTMAAGEAWPPAAVLFDALSQQHAWHALLFAERLPLLPDRHAGALTVPPSAALADVLDHFGALPDTTSRLAVLARGLLPRLVAGYRGHLARARPSTDAPVVRALRLVVRDEVEAQLEAEALLERAMAASGGAGPALEALAGAEKLLAGSGPGIGAWPAGPTGEALGGPGPGGDRA